MAGDQLKRSLFATIGRKSTIKIGANRFDKIKFHRIREDDTWQEPAGSAGRVKCP